MASKRLSFRSAYLFESKGRVIKFYDARIIIGEIIGNSREGKISKALQQCSK